MDYNGLYKSILLLKLESGEYIPLASVMPSYGPFTSLTEALADLKETFTSISNVPRGYTFCLIENSKPQEYWFTKEGDVDSIEKKNTSSSSSSTVISGVELKAEDGYIKVSYDSGNTWNNLVSLESLRGPRGYTGAQGTTGATGAAGRDADLTKLKLRLTSSTRLDEGDSSDSDDDHYVTDYTLSISYDGGNAWTDIGTIVGNYGSSGGSGSSGVIGIATYTDGNKYWTLNGTWLLDDENQMVRANGIDGEDGQDGQDGSGAYTQFKSIAFKRYGYNPNTPPDTPTGGTYEHPTPVSEGWSDGIPAASGTNQILWMTTKWFSTNPAITTANQWSAPVQATDTADIDFELSAVPLDRDPGNPTDNPSNWFDPDDTSHDSTTANWMAIRTAKNGYWGPWTVMQIRGENGSDGVSPTASFTSVIFKRSNNIRVVNGVVKLVAGEYPTGGTYYEPLPTNDVYNASSNPTGWSDGIPAATAETADMLIWMSVRKFSSDDPNGTQSSWSEPVTTNDSDMWDYEWCDEEVLPTGFSYPSRTSPDDSNPGRTAGDPWYDEPNTNSDPYWMAMRKKSSPTTYEWTYWQVMRVRGEKGDAGTSFNAKGTVFGIYASIAAARTGYAEKASDLGNGNVYAIVGAGLTSLYRFSSSDTDGTNITSSLTAGDAYTNIDDGHVYIWDGDNFIDFGQIQGPAGVGTYFHVKYSNDGGVTFTSNEDETHFGEEPGSYVGVRVDHNPIDSANPSDYTWYEWKGQDGFGYEYIFTLTAENNAPNIPVENINTTEYQRDDHVPTGWSDDPESPNRDYPYCWVCYRKKVDGVWQAWRGRSGDNAKAGLFAMWTSNGRGISSVTEMYAVSSSNTVAPEDSQFSTTIPEFDQSVDSYLWNYEIINYDDGTTSRTDKVCISASIRGKGIESIVEYYYAGPEYDTEAEGVANLPEYGISPNTTHWKTSPRQVAVNKDTPWLWNYEVIHWTAGTPTFTEPVIIAYYLYTDIEYLTNIFKKVDGDENTAQLGGLLGAVDSTQSVKAMLNATDTGKDNEHGRLFIASGMDGVQNVDNATFRVYEDGHVEANDIKLRDADITGFIRQYFHRIQDVAEFTPTAKINNPASNILLGWQGLNVEADNFTFDRSKSTLILSGSEFLNSDVPPGKIYLNNLFYIDSNGSYYYNKHGKPAYLVGAFFFPDFSGNVNAASPEAIRLLGGWIELERISIHMDESDNTVVVGGGFGYLITNYGGNVSFYSPAQVASTDANDKVIAWGISNGIVQSAYPGVTIRSNNAAFGDTYGAYKIVPTTKRITVYNTEKPLYLLFPNLEFDAGNTDCREPLEYTIVLKNAAAVYFKYYTEGTVITAENAPSLQDIEVATLNSESSPITISSTPITKVVKLTYHPYSYWNPNSKWTLEEINYISTL